MSPKKKCFLQSQKSLEFQAGGRERSAFELENESFSFIRSFSCSFTIKNHILRVIKKKILIEKVSHPIWTRKNLKFLFTVETEVCLIPLR